MTADNLWSNIVECIQSCTEPYCDHCTNADVFADVYYTGTNEDLSTQLYDEFVDACDEIKKIEGVANTFDPCPTISITPVVVHDDLDEGTGGGGDDKEDSDVPSGNDEDADSASVDEPAPEDGDKGVIAGVQENTQAAEEGKVAAGAIVGMVIAALLILALLILLCLRHRNQKEDEEMLKNLADEDEVNNQTLMLEDNHSRSYEDNDSRFGMYPEGHIEGMVLGERALNQDVHKCSSATCELCDRQNGVQFLPTRARSSRARMDLAGANRKYESDDAVNL